MGLQVHCMRQTEMLRTLLIADDREAVELIGSLIRTTGELTLERVVPVTPGSFHLPMALQTLSLDVILLDVSNEAKAFGQYRCVREKSGEIPVVTFAMNADPPDTPHALELPLSAHGLMRTVREALHAGGSQRKENVVAIVPAKAGGGATTIAINTAARLAGAFGKRVLVCENDLRSGVIAELLGLEPKASMQQTLESADSAEALIWPRHVSNKSGVDFLLTRREQTQYRPRWHDYRHLLSFVSKRYDNVLFDMPERIDDAAAEVVQSAKRVYLMTTPEILSLELARQRLSELRSFGVDASRLKLIVNRHHSTDMPARHIEDILQCSVDLVIPNNYPVVRAATLANSFVDRHTALGRAYQKLAGMIASGYTPLTAETNKWSFFGLLRPARRYNEALVVQRG